MATYCSATVYGERVQHWGCNRRAVVTREGRAYCRQHDPVAVDAKRAAKNQKHREREMEQRAILDEGHRLIAATGLTNAAVFYHTLGPTSTHGYQRFLIVSFEDMAALRLVAGGRGQ